MDEPPLSVLGVTALRAQPIASTSASLVGATYLFSSALIFEKASRRGVSTSPFSRRRFNHCSIVASYTPKTSTISLRGTLRSAAESTLSLKSFEQVPMPVVL